MRSWQLLAVLMAAASAAWAADPPAGPAAGPPPGTPTAPPAAGPAGAPAAPAAGTVAVTPMTLAGALAQALKTSPRLTLAQSQIASAKSQVRAAKAEGMPLVEIAPTGGFTRPELLLVTPALPLVLPPPGQPIPLSSQFISPAQYFVAELRILQNVDISGRIAALKRGAKRSERAAVARLESESQRLVYDVTDAYLAVLENGQRTTLYGALRQLDEERFQVQKVRLTAGSAIPLEYSESEADLAQAVQEEIEARSQFLSSGATLNSLIGRPAGAPLVLVDLPATRPAGPLVAPSEPPPTPERLRAMGLERPDLRALREDVQSARAQEDAARRARRPQLSLRPDFLAHVPEVLTGGIIGGIAGTVVQSLFDGGRSRARLEAARAERSRANASVAQGEREMDAQVEQARVQLDAAEQRLAADDRRVASATTGVEVARTRLRAGSIAPYELTEAQTTLVRAQTSSVNSRFAVARARARLAFVTGVAYPERIASLAGVEAPR